MKTTSVVGIVFFSESVIPWFLDHYLITAMFRVLYQQLRGTLTAALEGHLTIEDFMDMDVKSAPRDLPHYCMLLFLSYKPSF